MSYNGQPIIESTVVAGSTAQFTACSFDYTNIPGLGRALVNPCMIIADITIAMLAVTDPGDHGGRLWAGKAAWELNQGLAWRFVNSGSVIAGTPSPSFDVTGTTGRVRVIPPFAGGTWWTQMKLTIRQG